MEVEVYSGDPTRVVKGLALVAGDRQLVIERTTAGRKGSLGVYFEGITDRDAADQLRGLELEVPESTLPPPPAGAYYHYQLIGARVSDPAGHHIGTVSGIMETGANDVYVIAAEDGSEILIPATRNSVKEVDTVKGVVVVDLLGETVEPEEDQQARSPAGQ